MEPVSPALPAWVYKRDGRLVPFEADKISQALFAATERVGKPDAFLARELTDGIVHFLASEFDGTVPTTGQIAELVAKIVRELGHPVLAQTFVDFRGQRIQEAHPEPGKREEASRKADILPRFSTRESLATISTACLRDYTLQTVFTRDLVSAQNDGLLTLTGLETPLELAGIVLGPPSERNGGLIEALEASRGLAGGYLAIDGPEYVLAHDTAAGAAALSAHVRELGIGLRSARLRGVVNLNTATAPAWADDLADGPLFAGQRRAAEPERLVVLADALLEEIGVRSQKSEVRSQESGVRKDSELRPPDVRIDWHLSERDFLPGAEERLLGLARRVADGTDLAFVFDRSRRPVSLAEGMDRQHRAVLLMVGLHLPRLAEQPGLRSDPDLFLQKLGSLARLALSAATQKRDFLRRQHRDNPAMTRGFLLDKARLMAVPIGLESAVHALLGRSLCTDATALDFARKVLRRLRDVLRQDGRACQMDTCLDAPADFSLDGVRVAGLTPWDAAATVKQQLRAAGALQTLAETGTAAVLMPAERSLTAEQAATWLRWTWQHTEVVRLRFLRVTPAAEVTGPESGGQHRESGILFPDPDL